MSDAKDLDCIVNDTEDLDCIVTIPDGRLKGAKAESVYSGVTYYKFCGIPYAQPPVGPLRFKHPIPPEKWTDTLDATQHKSECWQFSAFHWMVYGSEDCLYLNVFTTEPPQNVTKLKPVVVELHGGGRSWGGSSFTSFGCPDFFIHHDVVFVSFNYRLNVFGFLNLDLPDCAGNMGLKDQNLALRWVKENIKYFGGDPNNVTLHGVSSGASDVHLHMMSPLSKGLFQKGIMQCGYGLNPTWTYQSNHIERAFQLAKDMKFEGESTEDLLDFFSKQDGYTLFMGFLNFRESLVKTDRVRGDSCVFYPTKEAFDENAFFRHSPRELIDTVSPIPLICSISGAEGLMAFIGDPFEVINDNFEQSIREHMWIYKMSDEMIRTVSREVKEFYLGDKEANEATLNEVLNIYTDIWYCEWQDWLDSISTNPAEAPVYVYFFDHDSTLNYQQQIFSQHVLKKDIVKKASHADDGAYFYFQRVGENLLAPPLKIGDGDRKVIENMTTLLTNFIKRGDPNDEKFENIQWVPHDANNPSYLHLDEELEVVPRRLFEERAAFWHNLMKRIKAHEKEMLC